MVDGTGWVLPWHRGRGQPHALTGLVGCYHGTVVEANQNHEVPTWHSGYFHINTEMIFFLNIP